jgi:DNA invertase Pin-like site-specific DNA recombinase
VGAFAEFGRALILERQWEGIAAAKQRDVYTGREPAPRPRRRSGSATVFAAGERQPEHAKELGITREARSWLCGAGGTLRSHAGVSAKRRGRFGSR